MLADSRGGERIPDDENGVPATLPTRIAKREPATSAGMLRRARGHQRRICGATQVAQTSLQPEQQARKAPANATVTAFRRLTPKTKPENIPVA